MPHDIHIICERVRIALPGVTIDQLRVSHPGADDDGLWLFRRAGSPGELQLESSTYDLPFLVETSGAGKRTETSTIDEAVEAVLKFFGQA